MKTLTKAQVEGLKKLKLFLASNPVPFQSSITNKMLFKTGVNTAVLHSLGAAGYISASRVYLGGICTADLKILKS